MAVLTEGPVVYCGTDRKTAPVKINIGNDEFRELKKRTISYKILSSHNTSGNDERLRLKFDAMASHDITYVGIIQTARASGLKEFPLPYVLTNCHNSLCAVGGTINEDDHQFGLSAAVRYGGEFVPAHLAVIHQYMREMKAGCGKMILGSDSHTRYGPLGTMAVGEGGPELVKQLLGRTYDISFPEIVCVYLEGCPDKSVGPMDVALEIIGAVYDRGFVKNKVLEFTGPAVSRLSVDFRNGIDVMMTEAASLTTIWETDEKVSDYLRIHGREHDYKELKPEDGAAYDSCVRVDLSAAEPMIALPFHPSNVCRIRDLLADADDMLGEIEKEAKAVFGRPAGSSLRDKASKDGFYVDQAVIGGCAGGTYENIETAANILRNGDTGNSGFWLSVYPASQPINIRLSLSGAAADLARAGVMMRSAFCGPCFGAGDIPSNGALSIRHNTRNFPNREGSKPGDGQTAYVALMDTRSIAATALKKGKLTPASDIDFDETVPEYVFDGAVYKKRVYSGVGKAKPEAGLKLGPGIKDWPEMEPLCDDLAIVIASVIKDEVTTTDELIPSGETSAYRSDPVKLAGFALSRKDPLYVKRAAEIIEQKDGIIRRLGAGARDVCVGSAVCAVRPGDGSAREQAASVQKVLGGWANICFEYATKRYRSNLINWGILPFTTDRGTLELLETGDIVYIPGIKDAITEQKEETEARLQKRDGATKRIMLGIGQLTEDERMILLDGCLINYYRNGR